MASIPGQGRTLLAASLLEVVVVERTAERPGILRLPLCNLQAEGISLALTSRRLFFDTGNKVERLMGSAELNIGETVVGG